MDEKPKPPELVYSKHRYLDLEDSSKPDYEKIFSRGEGRLWFGKHMDVWLLEHLDNQDDIIRADRHVRRHLSKCDECWSIYQKSLRKKLKEEGQMDLPLKDEET